MCINFETSLISFLIGEISGYFLTKSNNEKKGIGFFVMYYSLIQFIEMFIHKFNNKNLSKLHLFNLGTQGIVFFIIMKYILNKNFDKSYLLSTGIIAVIILIKIFFLDHKINKNKCLDYNLDKHNISKVLFIQYLIIFIYLFSSQSKILNKTGIYFFINIIITFLIENKLKTSNVCIVSYWCLSSAILAPFLHFIL